MAERGITLNFTSGARVALLEEEAIWLRDELIGGEYTSPKRDAGIVVDRALTALGKNAETSPAENDSRTLVELAWARAGCWSGTRIVLPGRLCSCIFLTSCSSSSNEDEKTDEMGNGPSGRLKIWRKSDREGIVPEVFRFPAGGRPIRPGPRAAARVWRAARPESGRRSCSELVIARGSELVSSRSCSSSGRRRDHPR